MTNHDKLDKIRNKCKNLTKSTTKGSVSSFYSDMVFGIAIISWFLKIDRQSLVGYCVLSNNSKNHPTPSRLADVNKDKDRNLKRKLHFSISVLFTMILSLY